MKGGDGSRVQISECGHFRSAGNNNLSEGIELEPAAACERRRSPCGAFAVGTMTRLASRLVNRAALVRSGCACGKAPRGERIFEAELVDRRPVLCGEIHHALGWI